MFQISLNVVCMMESLILKRRNGHVKMLDSYVKKGITFTGSLKQPLTSKLFAKNDPFLII